MAVKSERRKMMQAAKSAKKKAMHHPGGESRYARKRKYLDKNGGSGDSYPEPKPWKTAV